MGLTIHYQLRGPAEATAVEARALVTRLRARAVAFQRAGRVAAVGAVGSDGEDLAWLGEWLLVREDAHTTRGVEVPAATGFVFPVTLGEDSEPLRLGLCRYPAQVIDRSTGRSRAVRQRGWRLGGCCKTQYASLHGWEHFLRCHTAAVDLLAALRGPGLRVTIHDEGDYWPTRDATRLRCKVDQLNGIVAAVAGTMKDAADADGGAPVQSPIFAHPQFERIEAEGAAANPEHLAAAARALRALRRDQR